MSMDRIPTNYGPPELPIPETADPATKDFFKILESQEKSYADATLNTGVSAATLSNWKRGTEPTVTNLRKVLNTLGFDIKVVRM